MLLDLRLGYVLPGGRVEMAFWVNNLLDQAYLVDVFDISQDFDTILQVWGEPRTFGVTLSYAY